MSAGVSGHTMNTSDARESFDKGSNSNMSATQRPSRGESGVAASHPAHPHKVMLGLYIGAFLGMLSETSMNIALPDLMDEFSVSSGTTQWMVVGYMLAIGVVL